MRRWIEKNVVGLLLAVSLMANSYLYFQVKSQGNALKRNSSTQLINRANNVESWCGGINGVRDYDRAFVARVTDGHVKYELGDLPCAELVAKTLASPKHAQREGPLVKAALHDRP